MHKEIDGLLVPPGNAYTLLPNNPIMSELVQDFFFFFFRVGISFWLGLFLIIANLYFFNSISNPAICIYETERADHLCSDCTADQRLCATRIVQILFY